MAANKREHFMPSSSTAGRNEVCRRETARLSPSFYSNHSKNCVCEKGERRLRKMHRKFSGGEEEEESGVWTLWFFSPLWPALYIYLYNTYKSVKWQPMGEKQRQVQFPDGL